MANVKGVRKPRQSWLTKQREQYGDDWVNTATPDVINKNRFNLVQDIAFGNFNAYDAKEIADFSNRRILLTIEEYVANKVVVLQDIVNGLTILATSNSPKSNFTNDINNYYMAALNAYLLLYNYIEKYKLTGDVNYLIALNNDIVPYRNYVNLNNLANNISNY
ncbi:MAG: hypothetical protein ACI4V7_11100 [Succinivibrionaceae bacterium]